VEGSFKEARDLTLKAPGLQKVQPKQQAKP
jgi:hypothetical protein